MKKLKNLFILIAEDDDYDAQVISESFVNHSSFSKIEVVQNGQELLDYLNNTEKLTPDIIFNRLKYANH